MPFGVQRKKERGSGCGDGDSLWIVLRLGFEPANLFGVDIQEDRIRKAKAKIPLVKFRMC